MKLLMAIFKKNGHYYENANMPFKERILMILTKYVMCILMLWLTEGDTDTVTDTHIQTTDGKGKR